MLSLMFYYFYDPILYVISVSVIVSSVVVAFVICKVLALERIMIIIAQ